MICSSCPGRRACLILIRHHFAMMKCHWSICFPLLAQPSMALFIYLPCSRIPSHLGWTTFAATLPLCPAIGWFLRPIACNISTSNAGVAVFGIFFTPFPLKTTATTGCKTLHQLPLFVACGSCDRINTKAGFWCD